MKDENYQGRKGRSTENEKVRKPKDQQHEQSSTKRANDRTKRLTNEGRKRQTTKYERTDKKARKV